MTVLGRVDDAEKQRVLERADVLCAPSLGGESFGMVLTEAFAAGTPVVASDIAGYRDVVRDGVDGLLVPRGDATALAETLRDLWLAPAAARRMARAAARARRALRLAARRRARCSTPTRTRSRRPAPQGARAARRGAHRRRARRPAAARARRSACRASSRRRPPARAAPAVASPRRVALLAFAALALVGTVLAFRRIGVHEIVARAARLEPRVGARRPRA